MDSFFMNGYLWRIKFVNPNSSWLVDRTGVMTVATTDSISRCIYVSSDLRGTFLIRVLIHELGHCAMFSFGLIDEVHRMAKPDCWIEAEEWVCNFIADYGMIIFSIAYSLIGKDAWIFLPHEIEKLIA